MSEIEVRGAYQAQHDFLQDLDPGFCAFFGGWG